jgi:hypothetical protein
MCGVLSAGCKKKIRRLKSALSFFVTNYGLKSIMRAGVQVCKCASVLQSEADTVNRFVAPPSQISCHWLQPVVDDGTFERRIYSAKIWRAHLLMRRIFRQCRSTALQNYSPITSRYSLFTIRYSPFATRCRFGSAGTSPSYLPSRTDVALSIGRCKVS